jgi:hypothetical protein
MKEFNDGMNLDKNYCSLDCQYHQQMPNFVNKEDEMMEADNLVMVVVVL